MRRFPTRRRRQFENSAARTRLYGREVGQWAVLLRLVARALLLAAVPALGACRAGGPRGEDAVAAPEPVPRLIRLWRDGQPAFGVFVPAERTAPRDTTGGRARLAASPALDFLFLNLEGGYDAAAVDSVVAAVRRAGAPDPPSLLVRIPPISADGADSARARVAYALSAGADGVVIPHVRDTAEARLARSFFDAAGARVWSAEDPDGVHVAMLMLEDPEAVRQAAEVAALPGISVLACGIGSLTRALGGDRTEAERWNQEVLRHARAHRRVDMITAGADDVARRLEEGFLGIVAVGPDPLEVVQAGRTAAGR